MRQLLLQSMCSCSYDNTFTLPRNFFGANDSAGLKSQNSKVQCKAGANLQLPASASNCCGASRHLTTMTGECARMMPLWLVKLFRSEIQYLFGRF